MAPRGSQHDESGISPDNIDLDPWLHEGANTEEKIERLERFI